MTARCSRPVAKGRKKAPGEALLAADKVVAEAVVPYEGTLPIRALGKFAGLADQPPLRILCGAVIAAGIARRDAKLMGAGARMLAAHTLATWGKNFIKHRVDRTRPAPMVKHGKDHRPAPGRKSAKEETSFPSGHSAGAAAVAAAFARDYPEHRAAAYGAAGALALAQIPRCAHYPTDVGAGVALGVAAEALLAGAVRLASDLDLD